MLCRRGLGCEDSWSACELFNKLCSNFIIIEITSGRAGCIPVVVPCLRTVPGLNAPNGCFGGEPGAHGVYPLTQWAPSRLKKIIHAILLVASVYSHWLYGLWLSTSTLWGTWPW